MIPALCARSDATPLLGSQTQTLGRCCCERSSAAAPWAEQSRPICTELLPGSAAGTRGRWTPGQSWWLPEGPVQPAGYDRQTDRGRTITVPAVLKIQHPDPEQYWSELCIMHSDLWFNSLCFPPSTQQCILVFRTVSLTASANQNAAVTPTGLSSPVQATVPSYCLNRGNI